jgi:AcrR family transcriptional regulator
MRSNNRRADRKLSFIEQARRQQIVAAAIAAIAEEGYAGASLARIAQRAKISKSVVLYYFGGKDQLLETTINQIYEELWAFVRPRLEAEKSARGRLRAYIESEFAFLEHHRAQLLTISFILMNHRDRHDAFYLREEAEKGYLKVIGAILEQGQKNGEFRSFAVKPMANTLMHASNGALGEWATDATVSLSDYARELVTIFDLATQKPPPRRAARRS